jgi:hypothetical protein
MRKKLQVLKMTPFPDFPLFEILHAAISNPNAIPSTNLGASMNLLLPRVCLQLIIHGGQLVRGRPC